jgi:DNA-binding transcriptional regulator YiaG
MKIKANREASNLSCSEAAALIGECNIRTWKRWEAAEHMPAEKFQSLKFYARLYKAMIAEFKRGEK